MINATVSAKRAFGFQIVLLVACALMLPSLIHGQTVIFSTPGTTTWTVPPCVTSVLVEEWGGGGGGGGVASYINGGSNTDNESCSAGGGGGGGGFTSKTYAVTPGEVYTIVVGAGGNGGVGASSGTSDVICCTAGAGGNSTFSGPATVVPGTLTAFGGAGASGAQTYNTNVGFHEGFNGIGGTGGTNLGTNGDVSYQGGNGANGRHDASCHDQSGGGGGAAGTAANGSNATVLACWGNQNGGTGGASSGGNGGNGIEGPLTGTNSYTGVAGALIGGGGGGALIHMHDWFNSWLKKNGGAGMRGEVRLTFTAATANATITPAGPFCTSAVAVILAAATPGGTWSGTGITNATNGTFDPATAGPGAHTITYTIGGSCIATDTEIITVTAVANATITPAGPFCTSSAAVNLSAANAGGTWSGTGITNTTNGTFNPATAGPGTHTITYTIAGACGATDTETITVAASANATITPAGPFCTTAAAVNLSAANAGGTWSGTGITNTTNGTFNPATAGPGTHTITYTIGGACGATDTETITVTAIANATITPAGPFCTSSAAVNLSAANAGGTWSGTGITNTTNGTFNPATAGPGTHTITYTIAGACGATDTETITVAASANATITSAGPFCTTAAAVNLSAANAGGTWSGTGITNAANGTFDPATAGPGTHTITYTIGGACGATDTEIITVTALANATITPAGPYCTSAAAVNLAAATAGGTWSGTGITNTTNGTFNPATAGPGTHTITYTIGGACGATGTEIITVTAVANATITAAGPFCTTAAAVNLAAATAGGTWSGTGITNAANGTFNPATAGPGTHTITYTIGGACGATDTEIITVTSLANATITTAGPFCANAAALNLAAATAGGTWSGTGITNTTNGTFNPATAGPGTHTITYTIGGTCGATDTEIITVTAVANATITPAGPFCPAAPAVNLTAATAGGTWSGTGITNAANGTFDPATAGTGTFTITYTIGGACGATDTEIITVSASANATITAAGPFCTNAAAVTLVAATAGGTWSGTGITNAANGTFDPATAGPGTHTITYTIGGACGATDTETITVSASANATISPAGPFCTAAAAVNLTAVTAGGTWSGTGITNATNGTFNPATAGPGTHVITYTVGGSCGATDTETITVTANANATITAAGPFCTSASPVDLAAANTGGTWSGAGITNAANGTFNPATAGPGTHTITYTIGGSCSATDTETITVNNTPSVSATASPASVCPGGSTALSASGATFNDWSDGLGTGTPVNVSPTSTTTYTVTGTTSGCVGTATVTVTVNSIPNVTASANPATICPAGSATLNASGAVTFSWSNGLGSTNPVTVNPATSTSYTVTGTDGNGCSATASVMVTVNANLNVTAWASDDSICPGASVSLNASGATTYNWSPGAMSGSPVTVSPATSTSYVVTGTDAAGCSGTAAITIAVSPVVTIHFAASPTSGCEPLTVNFILDPADLQLISSFQWDFGDPNSSTDVSSNASASYTYADDGGYTATLSVTTTYNCTLTLTQYINVYNPPIAAFMAYPWATDSWAPDISFYDQSTDATTWWWNFGDASSMDNNYSNESNPHHFFFTPGVYTVTLIVSNGGCYDTISHEVTVFEEFEYFIPNSFTPNDDGVNDFFNGFGVGYDTKGFEMYIFDRWGEEVCYTTDPEHGWDGRMDDKDQICMEGTYVYLIKVKDRAGKSHKYTGIVTLIP